MDEVDENGATPLLAPPSGFEVLGGLQPCRHRRQAYGPSESAGGDHLLRAPHDRVVTALMPYHRGKRRASRRVTDALRVFERVGDRLLDEHGDPAVEAMHSDACVRSIRSCNHDATGFG